MNKNKINRYSILCLCCCPAWLWASNYQPENQPKERLTQAVPNLSETPELSDRSLIKAKDKQKPLELDEKSLLANPALLKRAMYSVVVTKQTKAIGVILPIYRQLPDADKLLIAYAQALLAHSQGRFTAAINDYRKILAKRPEMSAVRFDLANALYADRQSTAAYDQLVRLQSEPLPDNVATHVSQAISTIDRETDWQFDANFYYRHENNINNAPKQRQIPFGGGTLTLLKPEKARGIHVALGAKKRINVKDNIYGKVQFNVVSDYFWDNHDYDDLSLRAGVGLGYQDARLAAEIQPFAKKRFFGREAYSTTGGVGGVFSYRITPRWKLSTAWEWSYEDFEQRKHLNGKRQFVGLSGLYIRNPRQYWSAGVNFYDHDARDAEDRYQRLGAFVGWGQEWQGGISSTLTLSAAKRTHDGVDFFNIQRSDKEYSTKLSLWHRNIHYLGITPRLSWSWHKTDSNHFYYDKQESRVNIVFSKRF